MGWFGETLDSIKSIQIRQTLSQIVILGLIVSSALVIWKGLMCITGSESPVVVVLSESMEPGFARGDILFLRMSEDPIRAGEIIVFNVEGHPISIVHRVIKVHEREDSGEVYVLTKGDNNDVDDRMLYAPGQKWLERQHIMGRAVGFLPYVGWLTIIMTEKPIIKVLALSFHVNNFFERIQEALFNQYVIETLSGRPISLERHEAREFQSAGAAMPRELRATLLPRNDCPFPSFNRSPTFSRHASERHDKKIPIEYLHKLNPKNISAWSMKRMMRTIGNGSLTTLDERILNLDTDDESSLQIKTICQAKEAAKKIFSRVAKPRFECIFLEDLMWFMSKDEAMRTIHLFGAAAEKEGISKAALKKMDKFL
ncbi:Signal peptidase complex catalytic subunit SEC11C [Morus notabilis]|uniref:Signal peptidase complex catalytic subunit SEC11 n=1 Tax=Morus notabilis TaxID=981085 RepID=W9R3H4_9ROSA|nr:Signal peptidase complex catalytic subunit SEC11C [Morus notabilis]